MSPAHASPAANRPGTMRRRRALSLLTGVSGVALTMGTGLSDAAAAERPVPVVVRGENGQKADDFLINLNGWLGHDGTPGKDGGSLSLIDLDPRAAAANPAASIAAGSVGGTGGAGYERGWNWRAGSVGGRGGSVFVTLAETVTGAGDQPAQLPRFWVYSRGGTGGDGQMTPGGGGDAGSAGLILSSRVSTQGTAFQGVRVTSAGGDAGHGGRSDTDELERRRGGLGGEASLRLTRTGEVETGGDRATGLVVESLGGAGSRKGNDAYNGHYATPGGPGGRVSLDNAGRIATRGDFALGALVQSVGGNGGIQDTTGGGYPGARGGNGGSVDVSNDGSVSTTGAYRPRERGAVGRRAGRERAAARPSA
ncbi:hypothetical protein VQ03_04810, partial [Methylobacterium tarhaniae]